MDYAKEVHEKLLAKNIRAHLDDKSETLGSKIRDAQKEKVPYIAVVGGKEAESRSVAARSRAGTQEVLPLDAFVDKIVKEIAEKKL